MPRIIFAVTPMQRKFGNTLANAKEGEILNFTDSEFTSTCLVYKFYSWHIVILSYLKYSCNYSFGSLLHMLLSSNRLCFSDETLGQGM